MLLNELAKYILVLSESRKNTTAANDRAKYDHHLAKAAIMFHCLQEGSDPTKIKYIIADERRYYGNDFLSGSEGQKAESAFYHFAMLLESSIAVANGD